MTDSPAVIAHKQLYALYKGLDDSSPAELRLQVGILAAQIQIAGHLAGIERSLDLGILVRSAD
jgi:hypothetical protein